MEVGAATPEATVATAQPAGTSVKQQISLSSTMSCERHGDGKFPMGNRKHASGPQIESTGEEGNDK